MLPANQKDLLISTPNQGIPVSFAPHLIEDAISLKRAAREYYYPLMALKHLRALSSGLTGKNNVYIPNINDFKTNALQRVVVYVPGFKATVERRSNGNLVVTAFTPDNGYEGITRRSREKPGVYQVDIGSEENIRLTYKNNGRITPENGRNVIVANTSSLTPQIAAKQAISSIKKTTSRHIVTRGSFDMFYSPVGKSLGGLRSYTPEIHKESYLFGGLLADAMERANKQERVIWASESSGGVVLTQALQALALKNVSFEGMGHLVYMYSPTINPATTLKAIKDVKMKADEHLAKGGGHVYAAAGSVLTNASRARDKDDHYTWEDYFNDLSGGTMAALAVAGAASFVATAVTSSTVALGVGTFCSAAGAAQLASRPIRRLIGKVKP